MTDLQRKAVPFDIVTVRPGVVIEGRRLESVRLTVYAAAEGDLMDQTVDLSPYEEDGVRNHPLSLQVRVPIINRHRPRWYYITAIVVGGWPYREGPEPTDDEIRMIGSFHEEYCSYWYGPPHTGYRGRMLDERPFDIDGSAVGRALTKYDHGGWGYRLHTWEYGPIFAPSWEHAPMPLVQVLDRVHSIGDEVSQRWLKWKADHPDIFGGGS